MRRKAMAVLLAGPLLAMAVPGGAWGRGAAGGGTLSVRAFGARCDGAADDTLAVQAAFAAAASVPAGAVLEVPQGTCRLSATVAQAIGADRSIHLRGAGGQSGFVSANGSGIAITLTAATAGFGASDVAFLRTGGGPSKVGQSGVGHSGVGLSVQAAVVQVPGISQFRNLLFAGSGGGAWQEGLKLIGLSAPVIDGVRTFLPDATGAGTGYGLRLTGVDAAHYLTDAKVTNSLFQGGRAGILVDGAVQGVFAANIEAIGNDYGIVAMDPGGRNAMELVTVTNAHFNNALAGVSLFWVGQNQVSNSLFLHFSARPGVAWQAIASDHSGYMTVTGNNVLGSAVGEETFLKASGSILYTVTGNNVLNLSGPCIDTSGAANAVITGNSCHATAEPGIVLGPASLASANIVNGRTELVGPGTGLARLQGAGFASSSGFASFSSTAPRAAGTTQADATPLTASYAFLDQVPEGAGVRLPAVSGLPAGVVTALTVFNATATAARLYPGVGDSLRDAPADAAIGIDGHTETTCRYPGFGTAWVCLEATASRVPSATRPPR